MQLEVAPRALDDLKKIAGYIQLDKPGAAIRFVERIWREFDAIANHPMIFPAADGARVGFRLGRVGQYIILYRVTEARVRIERVVHGRRDLPNQLP